MKYDIALIGLGASNSLLLLALEERGILSELSVLILESDAKLANDKTFCFWSDRIDPINSSLGTLLLKEWREVNFNGSREVMKTKSYAMLESSMLYHHTKELVSRSPNITNIRATFTGFKTLQEGIAVYSDEQFWVASKVYDSRMPEINEPTGRLVLQSFTGWRVKTDWPNWDPSEMTLMDFEIPQNDFTQFMYILPISDNEALVEVTRFGTEILPEDLAQTHLRSYLFSLDGPYDVVHEERGVIPMSQHAKQQYPDSRVVSMGTRAGLIKATTGYGFKHMFDQAYAIANEWNNELRTNTRSMWSWPRTGIGRHYFYDHLLLHILKTKPHWGKEIFVKLFSNQTHEGIYDFLDEKSSFRWELGMFSRLPIMKFLWAVVASFFAFLKTRPARWAPMAFVLVSMTLNIIIPQWSSAISIGILLIMLFLVGIPHGALDGFGHASGMRLPKFILRYSGIMALVLLFWAASPIAGLLAFVLYSAWHFGETDMREWNLPSPFLTIAWGGILFALLLLPHMSEVNIVLASMGIEEVVLPAASSTTIYRAAAAIGIAGGLWFGSLPWLISILTLVLLGEQPLAVAFGTYFILQHSTSGWDHLKKAHRWSHVQMFMKALPFTLGAIALFLVIFQFDRNSLSQWSSYFLIFLSALSLPHIYFMSRLYRSQD